MDGRKDMDEMKGRNGMKLTLDNLCKMLEMPEEVSLIVKEYRERHDSIWDGELRELLSKRDCWKALIDRMKERIGEDGFGFGILTEMLDYACEVYGEYKKAGIGDDVFVDTMKFCTRFVGEHKQAFGSYGFNQAWWFPRQLAMQEFRIGELEYEFVDATERRIDVHIPSDADLEPEQVQKSFEAFRTFMQTYYPSWQEVPWYCDSWMLSPVLEQLLPETSKILMFQKLFEVESVNYEVMEVLDWVYPGERKADMDYSVLSERTSLQRNMKRFLLDGGKVGWAKGRLREV